MKDHILDIQPAGGQLSALDFLTIVEKEINVVRHHLHSKTEDILDDNKEPASPTKQTNDKQYLDLKPNSNLKESKIQRSPDSKFNIGHLLGKQEMKLDPRYTSELKEYQQACQLLDADGRKPVPIAGSGKKKTAETIPDPTFDEIYKSITNHEVDKLAQEEAIKVDKLDKKLTSDRRAIESDLPLYLDTINEYKMAVIEELERRKKALEFMLSQTTIVSRDEALQKQVEGMSHFYDRFSINVQNVAFKKPALTRRMHIGEYIDSSKKSKLLELVNSRGKKRKSPSPINIQSENQISVFPEFPERHPPLENTPIENLPEAEVVVEVQVNDETEIKEECPEPEQRERKDTTGIQHEKQLIVDDPPEESLRSKLLAQAQTQRRSSQRSIPRKTSGTGYSSVLGKKQRARLESDEEEKVDTKPEREILQDAKDDDLPPLIPNLDSSKYENLIYSTKKKKTYLAVRDFRGSDKNYFSLRAGDVVCSVVSLKGWCLVYEENNPKKFGFTPGNYLNLIS